MRDGVFGCGCVEEEIDKSAADACTIMVADLCVPVMSRG